MRVVISQSMLFPWVGLLEQVRLADTFVHYDDVQFSKGSFVNRVQIKTPQGPRWLTVPLCHVRLGQAIDEVEIEPTQCWRPKHLDLLQRSFKDAPYASDAMQLADAVFSADHPHLASLARSSLLTLASYFGLASQTKFIDVKEMDIPGTSSDRVLQVTQKSGGDVYITGHGAARYLDHEKFERHGVRVEYMRYRKLPYPQPHGPFDPHVSSLDLVAQCGREGARYICSDTVYWRDFLDESAAAI